MAVQLPSARAFVPPGAWIENSPRTGALANSAPLATGRMGAVAIWLDKGWTLRTVTFASATTAAVAPTNQWVALYAPDLTLLTTTNDDLATAWAAQTVKTFTWAAPFVVRERGVHYLGLVVVAGTVPSMTSIAGSVPVGGITPVLAADGAAGLTIPASAPATLVLGTVRSTAYAYVS